MWFKSKKQHCQDDTRRKEGGMRLLYDELLKKHRRVFEDINVLSREVEIYKKQSDDLQKQILDMQYKLGCLNAEYMTLLEKKVAFLERGNA